MDEVHKETDLHVDVGIVHGDAIYLIYRRESKDTLAFRHFTAGSGLYYLATGKAAMAFFEPDALKALVDRLYLEPKTSKTITDKKLLLKELADIRKKGYSVNREEFVPGLIAMGSPLFKSAQQRCCGRSEFRCVHHAVFRAGIRKAVFRIVWWNWPRSCRPWCRMSEDEGGSDESRL